MAELQLGLQREGSEHGRRATSTPFLLFEVCHTVYLDLASGRVQAGFCDYA